MLIIFILSFAANLPNAGMDTQLLVVRGLNETIAVVLEYLKDAKVMVEILMY